MITDRTKALQDGLTPPPLVPELVVQPRTATLAEACWLSALLDALLAPDAGYDRWQAVVRGTCVGEVRCGRS